MSKKTKLAAVEVKRGERMSKGKGWRLTGPSKRVFKATLMKRFTIGGESVALFRVLKHPDAK